MKNAKNLKHIFLLWILVLGVIFAVVRFFGAGFLEPMTHFFVYRQVGVQSRIYPYHFRPSSDIVIVTIDEATLNALQSRNDIKSLTIPKSLYAEFVDKLVRIGVKGIAFDIVFQNKDDDEETFRNTLEANKDRVVIATGKPVRKKCFSTESRGGSPTYSSKDGEILSGSHAGRFVGTDEGSLCIKNPETGNIESSEWSCEPDNTLGERYTCEQLPRSLYKNVPFGLISIDESATKKDLFFTTRTKSSLSGSSLFPLQYYDTVPERIYTLPAVLYNIVNGKQDAIYGSASGGGNMTVLRPFFGLPHKTYSSYSFIQVLDMSDAERIANFGGKYIFVGESGTMFHDQFLSPVSGTMMDGVESHAHALDALLQGRELIDLKLEDPRILPLIAIVTLIAIIFYLFLPKFLSPLFALMLLFVTVFLSRYVYFQFGWVIDIFPFLCAVGLFSFPLTFIYRFFIIDREKRMITSAFSHYVDPHVVADIAEQSSEINLGGESRELTILFSDIAGFTTLSEELPPADLFTLMSRYLSRMTNILIENGGTLDKYIGDAVMGFFGAPLPQTDHARRSCLTALAMRQSLPDFNTELTSRGQKTIDFRIGIASGNVMVGNIGSQDRFNYTVLGDTVNLASRLEATSKEYGTHIIVSEGTYEQVKDEFFFRRLDKIAVKGKHQGVMIYELIAKNSDTIDRTRFEKYEEALDLYFQEKYLDAGQLWEANSPLDAPSGIMALRCVDILSGKVKVENGVYVMTHK